MTDDECRDLTDVLSSLRRRLPDNRLIWCRAADEFETTVSTRSGLVLGGAWSPRFFSDRGPEMDAIPRMRRLMNPCIVLTEKANDSVAAWLPLMEAVAQAGRSLLIVTNQIATELLHTLIVNSVKGTLPNAVIRWSADRAEEFLGKVWSSPPSRPEELPQAAEAWVRRTGTALFPAGNEWRKQTSELEIISVGGESHEHQQERLLYQGNPKTGTALLDIVQKRRRL